MMTSGVVLLPLEMFASMQTMSQVPLNARVSFFDPQSEQSVTYEVPRGLLVREAHFNATANFLYVRIGKPWPKSTDDKILYEIYFKDKGRRVCLILPLGTYIYRSIPQINPGHAALIDVSSESQFNVIADVTFRSKGGKYIEFVMPPGFSKEFTMELGLLRYAPGSLDESRYRFADGIAQEFFVAEELKGHQITVPPLPNEGMAIKPT